MATENAIHPDADDEDKPVEHQQPPDPREAAIEAIENSQLAEFNADDPPEEPEKQGDKQIAAQLAQDDKPTILADGFDKFRIKTKVDGVEKEVSLDDVIRRYQKNEAADQRLADATRLLDQVRNTPAPKQEEPPTIADQPASKKKFITALFQGDEDGALAAFDEAVATQGRQQPTLDRNALIQEIAPALKQQLVVEGALDRFKKDYSDIASDTYLAGRADAFLQEALNDGKSIDEAFAHAGTATRDWVRGKAGLGPASQVPTTTNRNERLERKAAIDSIPSTSAKAVIPEMREEEPSDVIAEIRRTRGQG